MSDADLARIWAFVTHRLGGYQFFDMGNPTHFGGLVEVAARECGCDPSDEETRLAVALGVFGPCGPAESRAGVPPPSGPVFHQVLEILRAHVADSEQRLERITEFVIAYGCGKWRAMDAKGGPWAGCWSGAFLGLVRLVLAAVRDANKWLPKAIRGFPSRSDDRFDSDATMLARWFLEPSQFYRVAPEDEVQVERTLKEPLATIASRHWKIEVRPGARQVFTLCGNDAELEVEGRERSGLPAGSTLAIKAGEGVTTISIRKPAETQPYPVRLNPGDRAVLHGLTGLEQWHCSCATRACSATHRLAGWDPATIVRAAGGRRVPLTLPSFIASAVNGPDARMRTGAFVEGMYFALLSQMGPDGTRLRCEDVEFKVCSGAGCPEPGTLYEGDWCTGCPTPFDRNRMRRIARRKLILADEFPPHYTPEERLRCKNKAQHYETCTGRAHTGSALGAEWDNLYDFPEKVGDARAMLLWAEDAFDDCARQIGENPDASRDMLKEKGKQLRACRCPLCGGAPPQRPVWVWVRTHYTVLGHPRRTHKGKRPEDENDDEKAR